MTLRMLLVASAVAFAISIAAAVPCSAQWLKLKQFPDSVECVYFQDQQANPQTGFVGMNDGAIWRTIDNGSTWTQMTTPSSGQPMTVTDFAFRNIQQGWCVTRSRSNTSGAIWETTDGGLTWTSIFTAGGFVSIGFCAITNILVATTWGSSAAFSSPDFGITWDSIGPSWQNGVTFSGMNGVIGNIHAPTPLFSSDGGVTWHNAPSLNLETWSPWGIPGTNIFVAAAEKSNEFFSSTDGGGTWTDSYSFGFTDGLTGCIRGSLPCLFVQTDDAGFFCSVDTGSTWVGICGPNNFLDTRFYVVGRQVFAGDYFGGLWYLPDGIAAATVPFSIDRTSLSFSGLRCLTYDSVIRLQTSSPCPATAFLTGAQILSGNNAFSLPTFPIPLTLTGNNVVHVQYSPTGATVDSGKLLLEFKLGIRTVDTIISLSGTSVSAPSYIRTPSLRITSSYACQEQDSIVVIQNLSCDTLTVQGASLTDSTNFSIVPHRLPVPLPPGRSDTIFISANSPISGVFTSQLDLKMLSGRTTPISDSLPLTFEVFGSARASINGLNLVMLDECGSADTAVSIVASSCEPITVIEASIGDSSIFHIDSIPLPATVSASDVARWPVRVAPLGRGFDSTHVHVQYISGNETVDTTLTLELNVLFGIPDRIQLSDKAVNVGPVNVPCDEGEHWLTLGNNACKDVTIDSIAWVGSVPEYSFDSIPLPSLLPAGGSVDSILVHFRPAAPGTLTTILHIAFEMQGVRRDTEIAITGEGVSSFRDLVLTKSLQFDSISPCGTDTLQASIVNLSCDTVVATEAALNSGANFRVIGINFPDTLASGDTLRFLVLLKPTQSGGTVTDNVLINFVDGIGAGHIESIALRAPVGSNVRSSTVTNTAFQFSGLSPCSFADSSFTITNTGNCDNLVITDTTLTGYPGISFSLPSRLPIVISPDSSIQVDFRVMPGVDTIGNSDLSIKGVFFDSTIHFTYSAKPGGNALALSTPDSVFLSKPCATASKAFWIANTGCGAVTIDSVAISQAGTQFALRDPIPKLKSLKPGDTVRDTVEFDPNGNGDGTGELTISSKDVQYFRSIGLSGGLTNTVPTARIALLSELNSSQASGTAGDTASMSVVLLDAVGDSSKLKTVTFTLRYGQQILKLTKLKTSPGWTILDSITNLDSSLTVTLRDTGSETIPAMTSLLTEYFAIALTDSTQCLLSLSDVRFNDSDANYGNCTLASIEVPDPVEFTEIDTCGTPLLRQLLEGDLAIDIISVRPNPVQNNSGAAHLELTLNVGRTGPVTLALVDMLGRETWNKVVNCSQGVQTVGLDIPGVAEGTSFLEVSSGGVRRSRKVVVQRVTGDQ